MEYERKVPADSKRARTEASLLRARRKLRGLQPTTLSGCFLYIAAGWFLSIALMIIAALTGAGWLVNISIPVFILAPFMLITMAVPTCRQVAKSTKQGIERAITKGSNGQAEVIALKAPAPQEVRKIEAIQKEIDEPKRQSFEEKWKAAYPKRLPADWHRGEKAILFQKLKEEEQILLIVGGRFGRELTQAKIGSGLRHGIAVATNQRVLFLDKSLFSQEIGEMRYTSIESVTHSSGIFAAGMSINGTGGVTFKLEMIRPKEEAFRFADIVNSMAAQAKDQQRPETQEEPATKDQADTRTVADEIEKLGELMEKGLLTQTEFDQEKRRVLNQ